MPQISIIIPAYNAARYLPQTLDSVLAQTFRDWEVVLVNDGSTDETPQIAQRYADTDPRVRVLHQANSGSCGEARKGGYPRISPDSVFIIFLDADDIWEPDTLAILHKELVQYPAALGAHGLAVCIDQDGNPTTSAIEERTHNRWTVVDGRVVPQPDARETTFPMLIVHNCVPTPGAMLLRRNAYESVDSFDHATFPCEDWDLWIRLARRGVFRFVNRPVIRYRVHGSNLSSNVEKMWNAAQTTLGKTVASPENTPEQRRMLVAVHRHVAGDAFRTRLRWATGCLRHGQVVQGLKHFRHAVIQSGQAVWGSPFKPTIKSQQPHAA